MKRSISLLIALLAAVLSCEDKDIYEVKFSYQGIIDKEYRFNVGRVIPVTIGQTIETDGDISMDGKYFFYASNSDGGNFDIYLRSMSDITTVRITSHPSKDITPVISPNGKKLAFVSFRDDPEGDIFVMDIDSADLIKRKEKSVSALPTLDKAENITMEKDKSTDLVLNIKDSSPAWSPDGKFIAYSSSKDGLQNIWIMNSDGSGKKRITEKGGQYPSFSPDGNLIVFISYRDNVNGDIFIVDVKSGIENKIVSDGSLKLYPSFMDDASRIIYSSIEVDTNGNGRLDILDRSIIRFVDLKNNLSYPLTQRSESSFKAKWLPVLTTRDYNGIIIYTSIIDENINLNIIPETGIIPKKLNAKLQYEMCETYLAEYDDTEKYLLSLESVYNYYGRNSDNSSRAYVYRALGEAALYYKKIGERGETQRITSIIRKTAGAKDVYASFILDMVENSTELKSETDIKSLTTKFGTDKSGLYFTPFALEDSADRLFQKNDYNSALRIFKYIAANYSDFERILDIHMKISLCYDDLGRTEISDSAVKIFNSGNTNQKITVIKNFVDKLNKSGFTQRELDSYLAKIASLKIKFKDDKRIMPILSYASGLLYDNKGLTDKSKEELLQSIADSHPNDLIYYLANIKLGEIERRQNRFEEAEKYFSAGINRYSRRFKTENFKERLVWLINYYEQTGEKYELAVKNKEASETYDKLINLVTLMHNKRLYPEVYSEYAPKAHVLYIDSYTAWKGERAISDLEKSYNDKLPVFRMDFNRAAIYGLGYIYTKKALWLKSSENWLEEKVSQSNVYEAFKMADIQVDWALFIDDTFIESYILKSWIYQYIDYDRQILGDDIEKDIGEYFSKHLWEENIVILEKALNANDEKTSPENEGNIHLNMANNYFLLFNYPRALNSYRLAERYKKRFGSDIEKALFHFHLGYSLWQNNDIKGAEAEIQKAYNIYNALSISTGSEKFKNQYLVLYRYFALFNRYEKRYPEAIEWYKKILSFAEANKLPVDKARYNQEIAYCYIKIGDLDKAKSYLRLADVMLEKYPNDERKYYLKVELLKVGLFSIGPFPIYNLGADSVVIGDNRIFYPLDTENKKLLNMSMLEEIAVIENNYSEAINILKKKISILKDSSSVAVDTRIRTLNNIGYYSYMSGKPADAEDYFNRAGELASETDNLQGIFSSMMSLVNLYAIMIEDEKYQHIDWKDKITKLMNRIESYRNSYYDMRLKQEKDLLKETADAKKEKVSEKQLLEIEEKVTQETVSIYYSLDISAAVLKYYLAEMLYASEPAAGKNREAEILYSNNRDSFNFYRDALLKFEPAIEEAEKSGKLELKAKLILNTGSCYENIGEFEKAYVSFLDAKKFGEDYSLSWIKTNAYHKLGNFLNNHGREVEKSGFYEMADKNYNMAVLSIEEYPALYSSYSNRVKMIYVDYINFLIERGSVKKGFEIAERYAQVARIMAVHSLSPKFGNEYDRKMYYDYFSMLNKLQSLRDNFSDLLLSGKDSLSPEVISMKKKVSAAEEELHTAQKKITKDYSSIKPYIMMTEYKDPSPGTDIFRFHETGKGIFYWKISGSKIVSGYIKEDAVPISSDSSVFILLSETAINMVNNKRLKPLSDYIFVNTLDRVNDYMKDSNSMTASIYSEEKGIRSASDGIESEGGEDKNFRDYSLVIDKIGTGNDVTPSLLFSASLSPACLIQTGVHTDYNYLSLLMEGAFYAGTKRVIVTSGAGSDTVLPLVKKLYGKQGSSPADPFFALGYVNTFNDKSFIDDKQIGDREFFLYDDNMVKSDFRKAEAHLSRWNSVQEKKNSEIYTGNLWLIKLLQGSIRSAESVLNSYSSGDENGQTANKLRRAYTYLYSGDIKNAEKLILDMPADGAAHADLKLFNAAIKIIKDGELSDADSIYDIKKPYNTILPAERYFLPIIEFLYLSKDNRAAKIALLVPSQAYLSEGEHLMLQIVTGKKPPAGRLLRFDRIAALWNNKNSSIQREEAITLINGENGIDSLSLYPVLETVIRHEGEDLNEEFYRFINSAGIENIFSETEYIPYLILLKRVDDFYSYNDRKQERVSILKNILNISVKNLLNSIKKETVFNASMNYFMLENYQESYNIAVAEEKIFTYKDRNYADMQLLLMYLYIKSGNYKDAAAKGDILKRIENLSPSQIYIFNMQMSLIELNRLSSLKQASISDAEQFEKLFSAALSLVTHDTELLNTAGYREITEQVFDEYINYKMRTGQHTDAHYYNEVKKLIIASSTCGVNLFKKYAGTIDMETLQQILPEDGLYVNISKNKDDFFVWTADRKNKKAFVIENGFESFKGFMTKYSSAEISEKDLSPEAAEIAKILDPLYQMMKDKRLVFVSTDQETEKIPFEIAGEGDMLSKKSRFLYTPTLLLSMRDQRTLNREVYFPETDNSAQAYLAKAALRESGIKYSQSAGPTDRITQLSSKIKYRYDKKEFISGNRSVKSMAANSNILFASYDEITGAGVQRFLSYCRDLNLQSAILNGSALQDTNSAVFSEEFYKNISKGLSVQESFVSAVDKLKNNSRYSYPSNWSGYRLYIYNLNMLKEK